MDIKDRNDVKYIGIMDRRVFCCLNCPELLPEDETVCGFRNIYEALKTGFEPCPVCQPDMRADHIELGIDASPLVNRAVELINDGFLNQHTTEELSNVLNVSERHLRRAFDTELGISPSRLAVLHRAIFSKHLLQETAASVTDIAYTSGFGSVRQFNAVFRDIYRNAPHSIRGGCQSKEKSESLYAEYETGFDFSGCLAELSKRSIPGVEVITDNSYIRSFMLNGSSGYVEVIDDPENNRLRLTITAENRNCFLAVYHKIRRMLDIGRDEEDIRRVLGTESFGGYLGENSVPRLILWFDQTASIHYAVLMQELGHVSAMDVLGRYAELRGTPLKNAPEGIRRIYPEKIGITRDDCRRLGISERVYSVLDELEKAVNRNNVAIAYNQSYRRFRRSMMKHTDIDEPSINYIAMFGLGMKNAYTYESDWLVSLNLEQWSSYRSYAALIYYITGKTL